MFQPVVAQSTDGSVDDFRLPADLAVPSVHVQREALQESNERGLKLHMGFRLLPNQFDGGGNRARIPDAPPHSGSRDRPAPR